jgi:hypothetical protein
MENTAVVASAARVIERNQTGPAYLKPTIVMRLHRLGSPSINGGSSQTLRTRVCHALVQPASQRARVHNRRRFQRIDLKTTSASAPPLTAPNCNVS